jgi:hypothetical protein
MDIAIKIPPRAEATIERAWGPDIGGAAWDALLIEGYRTGKLSTGDLADALAFATRFEAERWLKQHDVPLNYTIAELEADRATLDQLLGPVNRS